MSLARLDHVIYSVRSIAASHRALVRTYPEAWPIGRFWPDGLTSGVAIGGMNLELIQFDSNPPENSVGTTLVFQPTSFEDALAAFARAAIPAVVINKQEDDPEKLRRRGFTESECSIRQWICRNLLPERPEELPFDFFVCEYSPFLRRHLSPDNPRLNLKDRVTEIRVATPDPAAARNVLEALDYRGNVPIRFVGHDDRRILEVITTSGPVPGF